MTRIEDFSDLWTEELSRCRIHVPKGGDPIADGIIEKRSTDGMIGYDVIEDEQLARAVRARMVAAGVGLTQE